MESREIRREGHPYLQVEIELRVIIEYLWVQRRHHPHCLLKLAVLYSSPDTDPLVQLVQVHRWLDVRLDGKLLSRLLEALYLDGRGHGGQTCEMDEVLNH